MLSAFVITFSERSRRKRIWRAISAVVVPESSMIVSPSLDHLRGGVADADLLGVVQRLLDRDRHVVGRVAALERAAVRADDRAEAGERVEVAADRDRGDREARHQLLDRDPLLLVEQLEDPAPALLDQQARRARPRAGRCRLALAPFASRAS